MCGEIGKRDAFSIAAVLCTVACVIFLVLQTDRGRLSGSWDHKSPLPAPSPPPANGVLSSSPAMPSRLMSTPYPEKKGSSMSVKPRPERTRQPSKDDSELALRSSGTCFDRIDPSY